jgi:hypothetical protein
VNASRGDAQQFKLKGANLFIRLRSWKERKAVLRHTLVFTAGMFALALSLSGTANAGLFLPLSPNVEEPLTLPNTFPTNFQFTVPSTGTWFLDISAPPSGDTLSLSLEDATASSTQPFSSTGAFSTSLNDGDAYNILGLVNTPADAGTVILELSNSPTIPSATPLPATLPLFAGGLGFVGYLTRRKKRTQAIAA